jgi:peptide deformylase
MALFDIRKYPDAVLRKKCAQIKKITAEEERLFDEMLLTMRHFSGIGLAAPQIGISKKLIVADIGDGAIKLANPVILKSKGSDSMTEGCLSVPDRTVDIERPYEIIASGLNEKGETVEVHAKGLIARVLQHEIDHLKGKLIIDYLNLFEKFKSKLPLRNDKRENVNA